MMNYDLIKTVIDSIQDNRYSLMGNKIIESLLENQKRSYNKSIKKGRSTKIGDKTIYPLIIVTSFEIKDKLIYESFTPFALAVIESDQKYFISLDEENQEISEIISKESLWDELEIK